MIVKASLGILILLIWLLLLIRLVKVIVFVLFGFVSVLSVSVISLGWGRQGIRGPKARVVQSLIVRWWLKGSIIC
jgi:hypothetical protein